MKDLPVAAFEPLYIKDRKDIELLSKKLRELLKRIKPEREDVRVRVDLLPQVFFNGGTK
jgi:hypothetical protein